MHKQNTKLKKHFLQIELRFDANQSTHKACKVALNFCTFGATTAMQ